MFEPYLRAGTRITLIVFSIPLGVSIALVTLEPIWARMVFLVLSLALIAANVDSARRVRGVAKATGSGGFLVLEVITTAMALTLVVIPWALGGLRPTREDLTWAILLAFAAGFLSISATVLSAFDSPTFEAAE